MLERIETIQGIGLLHQANGKPCKFEKATLIYADNGRGKSTLATILRSVSTDDPSLIHACKTVDGTNSPEVVLQFGNGHKVTFKNGAWSEIRSELLVFDADFIGRNVHSGGEVSTDHRRHLLEFALGEAAVAARKDVEQATVASRAAAQNVQSAEQALSSYHPGLSLGQFERLAQIPDIDERIADLQRRAAAANNVAAIQARQVPTALAEPKFDIEALFADLALSLENVHEAAETRVKQHIVKLGGKGVEGWLSQGRQFGNGCACPYCDQDISNSDLVRAYQIHFDAAYANLKNRIVALERSIVAGAAPSIVEGFSKGVGVARAQCSAWAECVSIPAISFNRTEADAALAAFRDFVGELVRRKQLAPAEPLGSTVDKTKTVELWGGAVVPLRAANDAIQAAEGLISKYKAQLSSANVSELREQLKKLQLAKCRYDPKVVDLFTNLAVARKSTSAADVVKKTARDKLDEVMAATLSKYQESLNGLLKKFGASFSIEGMGANFRGNAPRAEYGLLLRGKSIAIEGGTPPFAKALSDGDKRTLAFAFFIASTLDDSKQATRSVVIDDPMCSLDRNRRHHTRAVLKEVHSKAAQLIVLAHDSYFLRELRDTLRKEDKAASIAMFQLVAVQREYTDFASLDIDIECESSYSRHHRLLCEFADSNGGDPTSVAEAIRPLLEGYLHRRFPGLLPKDLLFGQVVALIRDSVAPSPLRHAKNLVGELNEINDYAGQFHHQTSPDSGAVGINVPELKRLVKQALSVVHKSAPP
jgi:wobble nucleotide-excising tRNase